jgi:DNA-binding beta-propeller fold protein YncE
MKKQCATVAAACLVIFLMVIHGKAQGNAPLKLVQTIPLPGVQGRMDHMSVDVKGKRLFVLANGDNQNTVEVIDLNAGKWISSIQGLSKPQGTFYSTDFNALFVTIQQISLVDLVSVDPRRDESTANQKEPRMG